MWFCLTCQRIIEHPEADSEHEEFHITYKMPCEECGQELTYCSTCDEYHHTDSFLAEHTDNLEIH